MNIEQWELNRIHPYDKNPRNNEDAIIPVANSIKEFGFNQPIVVDSSGVIIAGHTRYAAAKHLGLESVPVLVAEHLTDEQARAYRLADNKSADISIWIDDMLMAELADIENICMSDFGFDVSWEGSDNEGEDQEQTEQADKKTTIVCPHCLKEIEV